MSTFTEIVAEFPNLYKSSWTWPVPVPVAGTAPSLHLLSWPRSRPLMSDALKLLCKHGIILFMNLGNIHLRTYLKPCCGSI